MKSIRSYEADPARYGQMLDVRYGVTFNYLHQRAYEALGTILKFAQVGVGALAFAGYFASQPTLAGIAGLVVAILGTLQLVCDPSERAARFDAQRERWCDLELAADGLPIEELERRVTGLQARAQRGEIGPLANVAYNANLRANGVADKMVPLGRRERIANFLFA